MTNSINGNFGTLQDTLAQGGTTLVKFSAPWCQPCKAVEATLQSLLPQHPNVKYVTVDIEEQPEIAAHFQVRALPTVIVFQNGEPGEWLTGLQPKSKYQAALTSA